MLSYMRLEVLRPLRNPRYLLFAVVLPIASYLLFTSVLSGDDGPVSGLPYDVWSMVSLAAYGAISATLFATGATIAKERGDGWLRQLRITPLQGSQAVTAKVLASLTRVPLGAVMIFGTAVLVRGIHLAAWQWAAILVLLTLGSVTFATMGLAIGYLLSPDSAFGVTMLATLALPMAGGLWVPVGSLPSNLQAVAAWLPSSSYADLGWRVAAAHAPALGAVLILAAWTLACAALAALGYRRAVVTA